MPAPTATVIEGRYRLLEVIAVGGQGVIWHARDQKENRDVAAKILTDQGARNAEYAVRLAREQEALVALAGTSALAVFDLCRTPDGFPCLITELLRGTDLERHLSTLEERKEHLGLPRLFEILDPIVDTLERAHAVGILHRDLKPANIFLLSQSTGGGVRLLDFGLSRMKSQKGLTQMGTIMGSPSYIAPEVWRGNSDDLDDRVDVFSVGVVIFRALTGALPFDAASVYDKYKLVTTADRPSLHALRPDLPRVIDEWSARALAIDRDQRFSSIRELWRALSRSIGYTPPKRTPLPVAAGLVSAWRAARGAFKRFVDTAASAVAEPEKRARPPVELNALSLLDSLERDAARGQSRSGWLELDPTDLLIEEPEAPSTENPDAATDDVEESPGEESAPASADSAEASTTGTGKKQVKTTEARGKAKASRKTLRNEARRKGSRAKATKR